MSSCLCSFWDYSILFHSFIVFPTRLLGRNEMSSTFVCCAWIHLRLRALSAPLLRSVTRWLSNFVQAISRKQQHKLRRLKTLWKWLFNWILIAEKKFDTSHLILIGTRCFVGLSRGCSVGCSVGLFAGYVVGCLILVLRECFFEFS